MLFGGVATEMRNPTCPAVALCGGGSSGRDGGNKFKMRMTQIGNKVAKMLEVLEHLNLENSNLFLISDFEFRI